ncbi:MAG: class I SAM-dependent methyltransferase [Phycisphaerae bacterium]
MARRDYFSTLIPVIWQDDDLIAVAKPYGVDVGGRERPLPHGIIEQLERRGGFEPGTLQPINRLALYESGVLLMAKTPAFLKHLRSDLRDGKFKLEYLAVVLGKLTRKRVTLRNQRRVNEDEPPRDRPPRTSKKRKKHKAPPPQMATPPSRKGPETTLSLQDQKDKRSLVRAQTNAGSTHALRAQLRGASLRLQGDSLNDRLARRDRASHTYLHLLRTTFRHPRSGQNVVLQVPLPDSFDDAVKRRTDAVRPLHAALVRRNACLEDAATNCLRLINGPTENLKGIVAERYGPIVIIEIRDEQAVHEKTIEEAARWYLEWLDVKAVYLRVQPEEPDSEYARHLRLIAGADLDDEIQLMERGLRYVSHPMSSSAPGLFLDQRDNRTLVRKHAETKRVLNLFAYTGGFSLAAAAGGAAETVSVDLSPRHLEWARANFALNGYEGENFQFIKDDALDYLRRAKRQEREFDLVIIDAPSFAHGRKRKKFFSFTRDMPELIREASAIMPPGAGLMVGTNLRQLTFKKLKQLMLDGLGRRRPKQTKECPLPPDFASDRNHSKTMLMWLH